MILYGNKREHTAILIIMKIALEFKYRYPSVLPYHYSAPIEAIKGDFNPLRSQIPEITRGTPGARGHTANGTRGLRASGKCNPLEAEG